MNFKSKWRHMLPALLFVSLNAYGAIGEGTGNIVGSLQNQSGSSYSVNASDESTGRSRDVDVDAEGDFRFSQLPVGTYVLTVRRDNVVVARDTFDVSLNGNTTAVFVLQDAGELEEITVTAAAQSFDTYSTDSGVVIGETEIDLMPIARNLTSVALLAPGTVKGDVKWDVAGAGGAAGYASFGGSSVAENSCYINGLEVTNTRQGLGCGELPFEFYNDFQIKTGGYSAVYGRTTGGVINATSKSGSNDWEFGVGVAFEPGSLYDEGKISRGGAGFGNGAGGPGTGRVFRNTTKNEVDLFEYWVTAGGPIIEDRLFFYGIVNPRETEQRFQSETSGTNEFAAPDQFSVFDYPASDNIFWGGKIDWDITDYHRLSVWGFDAQRDGLDKRFEFDAETGTIGAATETFTRLRGSKAHSVSYRGTFLDQFTVSGMWGVVEAQYTNNPAGDPTLCPSVDDERFPTPANPITGCGPGGTFGTDSDENTQMRFDLEWAVGDHVVRVGYDQQDRDSVNLQSDIGGGRWVYSTLAPNGSVQGNAGPIFINNTGDPVEYAQLRVFTNAEFGGAFNSELEAYYIEDEWQLNDNLVLYIGARQDTLTNFGTTGVAFADFEQEWAPRLGMSWDPVGDGANRVYGTWGRYFLPMANNTNFRVGSGVSDTTTYYTYTGVNTTDGTPTGLTPLGGQLDANNPVVNSAGAPPTKAQFQAAEADAFYKDELILGYERYLENGDSASVRVIRREVGVTLDDYCGILANQGYCTMINPGSGGSWEDLDGNFEFHSAEDIGIPEGDNEYTAVQLEYRHTGDRMDWTLGYNWSRSVGNFEGAVKSDITQADAGITQDFDFPALMDGAFGYLPNDRRHAFKFYGSYRITENLIAGWASSLISGRPLSTVGAGYPDTGANVFGSYGDTYYLFTNTCNTPTGVGPCPIDAAQEDKIYRFTGRGNAGRTPWLTSLDASLTYGFEVANVGMTATLQVFNVFDIQEPLMFNEHAEARRSEGNPNEWFGAVYAWQEPRHVRLSLQARF
jgi:hypothetical protein